MSMPMSMPLSMPVSMAYHRNDKNWVLLGRRTVLTLRVSDREVGRGPSSWSDRGILQVICATWLPPGKEIVVWCVGQLVFPEEYVYGPDQWPLRLVDVTATKVAMRQLLTNLCWLLPV